LYGVGLLVRRPAAARSPPARQFDQDFAGGDVSGDQIHDLGDKLDGSRIAKQR
jgi:hypothetical protein